MKSTYVISDDQGSSRGLKVWFRFCGFEIDPDIMELQEEINRIKRTISLMQEDDIENSEWKEYYESTT